MILVDTSVWVEHLRRGLPRLAAPWQESKVLIERDQLMGRGIGSVDAHLLTSAKLHRRTPPLRTLAVGPEESSSGW